jgi:uncharacterized protein YuzB (UPF0349 family)
MNVLNYEVQKRNELAKSRCGFCENTEYTIQAIELGEVVNETSEKEKLDDIYTPIIESTQTNKKLEQIEAENKAKAERELKIRSCLEEANNFLDWYENCSLDPYFNDSIASKLRSVKQSMIYLMLNGTETDRIKEWYMENNNLFDAP